MHGEVYKATDGWRFRIRAENGEIIATGEAYENEADCRATMDTLLPVTKYDPAWAVQPEDAAPNG